MANAKPSDLSTLISNLEKKKSDLTTKQEELKTAQQKLEELQNTQSALATQQTELDNNSQLLLKEVSTLLGTVGIAITIRPDELIKNKEKSVKFVEEQLQRVQYKKSVLDILPGLIEELQSSLQIGEKLDIQSINTIVNKAVENNPQLKDPNLDGFNLLMKLLGDDRSRYSENLTNTTDTVKLNKTLRKQKDLLAPTLDQEKDKLNEINSKLIENHDKKILILAKINENTPKIKDLEQKKPIIIDEIGTLESDRDTLKSNLEGATGELERRNTLLQSLVKQLDAYESERTSQYKLKDTLSPADKEARSKFIETVKKELAEFYSSGNADGVIQTIQNKMNEKNALPGFKLRTTLNQIITTLLDATAEKLDKKPTDQRVEKILKKKEFSNGYSSQISGLLASINEMKQYAKTLAPNEKTIVSTLAAQLKLDVNSFIVQNPDKLPTTDSYQKFAEKFIARLHSQDAIMNKHTSWKPIIKNILAGVSTLGIALGIKLIHSKATTGRFSLFFDKTQKQEKVSAVEEKLKEMLHIPENKPR